MNRKEFLNLFPFTLASMATMKPGNTNNGGKARPNIIILVFDAWSSHNVPFLGYGRDTTPNITPLLDRSLVFHNHYAGATSTTPGTATLLTGTLPWKNRALRSYSTPIHSYKKRNLFTLMAENGYHNFSYTHNPLADEIIKFFRSDIQQYIPRYDLFFSKQWAVELFPSDSDSALITQGRIMRGMERMSNSLFFGRKLSQIQADNYQEIKDRYKREFQRGVPFTYDKEYFILETAIDWLIDNLPNLPQPFFGYYHMLPPHKPYFTRREFVDIFKGDGLKLPEKERMALNTDHTTEYLDLQRREYDEYIAYVDFEFARLFEELERSGVLDNTWLILTSDHGEMFERGTAAHGGPTLFQPVIQVPLVIFEPGRTQRQDIFTSTSAVDLLPTLMHIIGEERPSWCEGELLPPLDDNEARDRNIYAMMARRAFQHSPLTKASFMLLKEQYKLTYYIGYKILDGEELVELYDLENDPQEMENLYSPDNTLSKDLFNEMKQKVKQVNVPYINDQ